MTELKKVVVVHYAGEKAAVADLPNAVLYEDFLVIRSR